MKTANHKRWAWTAMALVTGTAFAQEPPLPQPAPPVTDQEVVPAVVLPPQPVIPAPVIPATEPEIEAVGHRGARLQRPIAVPAGSMPIVTNAPMNWPNLSMPLATSAAPQWRWYGWGAANSAGWGRNGTPVDAVMNALPAPTPVNTPTTPPKTPPQNPPTGLIGDDRMPDPSWNAPPKKVESPPNIPTDAPAPTLTPPNLDMNLQSPRPPLAPTSVPTSVDPWTSIGPGAKAVAPKNDAVVVASTWKTVRASSK